MTMTVIQHQTLGGSSASITFSSIPNTYTDLLLVTSTRNTQTANDNEIIYMRFNSDAGANYSWRSLIGTGSTVASTTGSSVTYAIAGRSPNNGRTASVFDNNLIYIPNYAGSTSKSASTDAVEENNATAAMQSIFTNLWTGTAAINSITILPAAGSFVANSSATLYGILKGSSGGVTVS